MLYGTAGIFADNQKIRGRRNEHPALTCFRHFPGNLQHLSPVYAIPYSLRQIIEDDQKYLIGESN
jgi:hypothetical protein